ncbi:MAG: hypothetical protein OXT72_11470 [Gammaproteobacteria bacterium]|nr:hypothetical protein [Gammaproteobacteria bacterium]MDE0246604.1 hypothetical protein [Gammaproteobacteria bacterium]
MENVTISSLDDATLTRRRDDAASTGRSVEEETCVLICRWSETGIAGGIS